MDTEYAQTRINYAMKSLENALSVSDSVDYHDDAKIDQSPAYVIGYSTSTIKNVLFDLKTALEYLN